MTEAEKLLLEWRRRGLSAWKLAALADVDPSTYSQIERGERAATFDQKTALAQVLGVEPETRFSRVTL